MYMEPKKQEGKGFYIVMAIVYLFTCLLACHVSMAMNPVKTSLDTSPGRVSISQENKSTSNLVEAISIGMQTFQKNPVGIFPWRMAYFKSIGLITVIMGLFVLWSKFKKEANAQTMHKNQNGSSEWNTNFKKFEKDFGTPWVDREELDDPNILLSKNLKLGMDIQAIENKRNLNCMVIGGSGTGKSFRVIKPNIMQMNCSTITTDPSGELLECCGKALVEHGVRVKVFSTSDMIHSNCYNPFDYVYDENGKVDEAKVSTLIYLFLKNANGAKEKSGGDPFWEKSAKALLSAIAYYMLENESVPKESINFNNMLKMIQLGKVNEESSSSKSALDKLMDEEERLAKANGRTSKAISNYKTFKLAPPKTANSILITCAVDLQLFDNVNVQYLTRTDTKEDTNNIHLEKICAEKTALFINIPQANGTFQFLVAMLYSQLFDVLYTTGEKISPNKYMIVNKHKVPLITFINSKEEAEKELELLKTAVIEKRTTKRGADFFQIKNGKKVLREVMSEKYAKQIIVQAQEAVVKNQKIELPFLIRCLMDEFANIGEIPDFPQKLATMRKYGISCTIVLQNVSQLKEKYDKGYEGVIGNCDSLIFLGSKENDTCKYISEMLGKATIVVRNTGRSLSSKGGNTSQNYNHSARDLMDAAEVAKMDNKKSIVIVRGLQPFYDDKYDFFSHPNFKGTGDADPNNKVKKDFMDVYFNSVPFEKKNKTSGKKKINQTLPVEMKRINTKEDLLETIGSKTDAEFLERTCSTPPVSLPKPKAKIMKSKGEMDTSTDTSPKPSDDSNTFVFGA